MANSSRKVARITPRRRSVSPERVQKIKSAIEWGDYETQFKLMIALDKLIDRLEAQYGRTPCISPSGKRVRDR